MLSTINKIIARILQQIISKILYPIRGKEPAVFLLEHSCAFERTTHHYRTVGGVPICYLSFMNFEKAFDTSYQTRI